MTDETQPYEYRGMIAKAWDLLRGDTSEWPDRAFYRAIIEREGGPALDVDGVDLSPEMLALCREKAAATGLAPTLYEQSMEALDLPRRYRVIFVPSSSIQLLTDERDAAEAMRRFFAHLEPGGVLVAPFMVLWPGDPPEDGVWSPWYRAGQRERPEDGALVRRVQRAKFDMPTQLEHTEDRYEVIVRGEIVETEEHRRSPATRWYTQDQARTLFAAAGLEDARMLEGFTAEPASAGARIFTLVGRRAG